MLAVNDRIALSPPNHFSLFIFYYMAAVKENTGQAVPLHKDLSERWIPPCLHVWRERERETETETETETERQTETDRQTDRQRQRQRDRERKKRHKHSFMLGFFFLLQLPEALNESCRGLFLWDGVFVSVCVCVCVCVRACVRACVCV